MKRPRIEPVAAIAFDLDGTLIDTAPDLRAALQEVLAELGFPPMSLEQVVGMIGGGVDALVERALTAQCGFPPDTGFLWWVVGRFKSKYEASVFVHSRVYPSVAPLLESLRARGHRLACITNKEARFARPLLEQAGLAAAFEEICCAEDARSAKPAPQMILELCQRWALAPEQLLMIGDSVHDVAAAKSAGASSVAVLYGYGEASALQASQPTAIVREAQEILNLIAEPDEAGSATC